MTNKTTAQGDKGKHIDIETEESDAETTAQGQTAAEDHEGIGFPSRQELEDQLTAMEMKVDEHKNEVLRIKAEMENLRKRNERDVANAHKFGNERLLVDLIPVIDSITHGLEGGEPTEPKAKAIWDGLQMTLDMFTKTLTKHGVAMINPQKGDAFNPELHEAMSMQHDTMAKPNTILQVIQPGYQLNGRVIRAAMVIVSQ
jgi:molecular chaperone GrpE